MKMFDEKNSKKKYLLVGVLFLLILISYNFRFEIMYNISTAFGYDENKARRYSLYFPKNHFKFPQ